MSEKFKLILASASPRRLELLQNAGYSPLVIPPQVDESVPQNYTAAQTVAALSLRKCEAVAAMKPELTQSDVPKVIIAADTVVYIEENGRERILGKPKSAAEAKEMLRLLRGNTHTVYTGVAIRADGRKLPDSFVEATRVTFAEFGDDLIDAYVATGEPMDKAGAYGIQRFGAALIEKVDGDYFNVVGLPLPRVLRRLRELGFGSF